MTYLVDAKRRVTLPPGVPPGSAVMYEPEGEGCWRVVVLRRPAGPEPAIARKVHVDIRKLRGIDLDQPAFPSW